MTVKLPDHLRLIRLTMRLIAPQPNIMKIGLILYLFRIKKPTVIITRERISILFRPFGNTQFMNIFSRTERIRATDMHFKTLMISEISQLSTGETSDRLEYLGVDTISKQNEAMTYEEAISYLNEQCGD